MSEISMYEAQKKKMQGLCDEHDLVYRFEKDRYPIIFTIKPVQGMDAQISMLENVEEVGYRSPDASMSWIFEDGGLDTKVTGGTFTISKTLRTKIESILVKMIKDKTLAYTPAPDEMVLTVHRWFANKSCPGNWMYARMGDLAEKVTAQLSAGTDEEDDDMDINKFKELWREMRKELQDNDASAYSEEARKWAVDNGIIRGGNSDEFNGMWEDMMTREQLVTVLYRFAQKFGLS